MPNKFSYTYYSLPATNVAFPVGRTPSNVDYIAFYVCEAGNMDIKINNTTFHITANTLCVVLPGAIISIEKMSQQSAGFGATASILFIDKLFIPNIGGYYTHIKNSPFVSISPQQLQTIKTITEIVNSKIDCDDSQMSFLVVQNLLNSLVYEIISCYANGTAQTKSSRQDKIFREFMLHVFRDHKTERSLSYYADTMCITTRYLSAVIKELTGYPASSWINSMVTSQAKNLLRTTDLSIQQIAHEMNFANASFFGQYFRKYTGVTPLKYRNGG
ncbi:MAG: helix-turn-helix domain-containing protein [Bacteroidales bacterium]|nr:helix-turn-helix domain-containing protein [Bacteroidales bacterium]